jgi:hypothetical protein
MPHRRGKLRISVTGIAIVRTSHVWLGCSVRVSETAARPWLVPLKVTYIRRGGMGAEVSDLQALRFIPNLHPRLQFLKPSLLGGSSFPGPTANR